MLVPRSLLLTLSFVLAGCGGPGSPDAPQALSATAPASESDCLPLGGGEASLQVTCTYCSSDALTDAPAAVDGDTATAASLRLYNPIDTLGAGSQMLIRARAQEGVVFAEGSRPGVLVSLPEPANVPFTAQIFTFLQGVPQGGGDASTTAIGSAGSTVFLGLPPVRQAFDEIGLLITQVGGGLEEQVFQLHEFCGDGQ